MNSSERATFRRDNFQLGDLLDANRFRENWIYLRKNVVEIEDA